MSAERIQKLNDFGFVWDASKVHSEAQWLEMMHEMKDYKLNHGDTLGHLPCKSLTWSLGD